MSCSCQKFKISGMKKKNLMSSAMNNVLAVGGAVLARKGGAMIPDTVDPMYVNIGKVALGVLAPTFMKGKSQAMLASLGTGIAIEGALQLLASYGVAGFDNQASALAGWDNGSYALNGGEMKPRYFQSPVSVETQVATA